MEKDLSIVEKSFTTQLLHKAGVEMMKQTIQRRLGESASSTHIQEELSAWLYRKNDAVPGDVGGSVRIRSTAP